MVVVVVVVCVCVCVCVWGGGGGGGGEHIVSGRMNTVIGHILHPQPQPIAPSTQFLTYSLMLWSEYLYPQQTPHVKVKYVSFESKSTYQYFILFYTAPWKTYLISFEPKAMFELCCNNNSSLAIFEDYKANSFVGVLNETVCNKIIPAWDTCFWHHLKLSYMYCIIILTLSHTIQYHLPMHWPLLRGLDRGWGRWYCDFGGFNESLHRWDAILLCSK